ncbi:MAG TPA: alpha/beta fold hydrolase [Ferruginibacter sp.]|nr:alpha/beta fold hydrolase [Ferruginibacter sp.]
MLLKKSIFIITAILSTTFTFAQNKMTPELLWQLGRVTGLGISKDGQHILYNVSTPDVAENKSNIKSYSIPLTGGDPVLVEKPEELLKNKNISPDGKHILVAEEVKVKKVSGEDYYPELTKSNVYIIDSLNYRHWDKWMDGKFNHLKLAAYTDGKAGNDTTDIMPDEPYNVDDFMWSHDGKQIIYSCKKKYGTANAISTNTDIYAYEISTGKTTNLTEGMMGYDVSPSFNKQGQLAWLSMKRDGYESDKSDVVVANGSVKMNLTASRDDIHVDSYKWSEDGKKIYFLAPVNGTSQLFEITYPGLTKTLPVITQITKGDFDVDDIIGQSGNILIVGREDINHAKELYNVHLSDGSMQQLTHINTPTYATIGLCKTERRFVKTTDGKDMLVWIVYPPNFDSTKKYPTLLYCQGGPQVALTQFYSFRWNFQLMASQGYIVVAPNRRGMPGHGTQWNEEISKDWGGQVMQDYLSAIDDASKLPYVDKNRLGCVGASYGGFSVFYLAGIHNNRFKTFIAHDGVFDFRSMYGTTDELFFENWEMGGAYWEKDNAIAQKSFSQSPSNMVEKWNTPILIFQGGKDYRVSIGQGQQAFQAAQLRGIKSRFIYFPEENHWVLSPQNALVWQHEFFKWLDETLK